jgi:hypothetical protein
VIKHPTHPKALELVRRAAASLPGISVSAHIGLAYTDALVATKRNLIALTLGCLPEDQSGETSHWHQISDTLEHVDLRALEDSLAITWQVLKEVDKL